MDKRLLAVFAIAFIINNGMVHGGGMEEFGRFLSGATDLANRLGTSGSGQMNIAGRTISWSFQGQIMGFEWKYMGVCTDSKTGETVTVFKQSKGGAVEHCLKDLMQRLAAKQEL